MCIDIIIEKERKREAETEEEGETETPLEVQRTHQLPYSLATLYMQ